MLDQNNFFLSIQRIKGRKVTNKRYAQGSYTGRLSRSGAFDGLGVFHFKDGRVQSGTWKDGLLNGEGRTTYPSGSSYEGTHVAGKKSGRGILVFADGTKYEGEFVAGKMEGIGKYEMSDGSYYGECAQKKCR